jgi:hypothetical protein
MVTTLSLELWDDLPHGANMAEDKTQPTAPPRAGAHTAWASPQVVTAIITGMVTLTVAVIGIVPTLIRAAQPTPTPTFTPTAALTATFTPTALPPTAEPTIIEVVSFTAVPSSTPLPALDRSQLPTVPPSSSDAPSVPRSDPNALLIFDNAAFTLINVSALWLSLDGVQFRSSSGNFDASQWANANRIPEGNCVRLRDLSAGPRNPPGECENLLSLFEVGSRAMFWANTSSFEIVRNGEVVASCETNSGRCSVHIPRH